MQITAPIHHLATSARGVRASRVTHIRGHRQRRPLQLRWQLNLAVVGLISLGIAACILLQM